MSVEDITEHDLLSALELGYCRGRQYAEQGKVEIHRWVCPACEGTAKSANGDECRHCHGYGLTNDVDGWKESSLKPAPRPPAVMKSPCSDCAYRPGSPEGDSGIAPGPEKVFFCHHGLLRLEDGYVGTMMVGQMPIGAMVCASWWDMANGRDLPTKPFRDPGGNDRSETAPEPAR